MYNISGRIAFLIFLGFMSFRVSIFGIAAMAWLYFVGFIHCVVVLRYPVYGEFVRQKDYYGAKAQIAR